MAALRYRIAPAGAGCLGLVALAAIATVIIAGCTKNVEPESSQVLLEAATSQGDSPWTESVAEPVDLSKVVTLDARVTGPAGQASAADGSVVGLYGGTNDQTVCDTHQLVDFLQSDPAKAAAWRDVLGVGDIPDYVDSLRQVVLLRDTVVTDHGYQDGHATAVDALLQSGTAILVDGSWVPRVRCASGSPLTPADVALDNVTYTGPQWANLDTHKVVAPSAPHVDSSSEAPSASEPGPSVSEPVSGDVPPPDMSSSEPPVVQPGDGDQPDTGGGDVSEAPGDGGAPPADEQAPAEPGAGDSGGQAPAGQGAVEPGAAEPGVGEQGAGQQGAAGGGSGQAGAASQVAGVS